MAYRVARWGLLHAARVAGAANITATDSAGGDEEDASFPVENLIDDRVASLMKFASSGSLHRIDVDRGAGFAALDGIDRIYIPVGHNLTGTVEVFQDDNAAFSSRTIRLSAVASIGTAFDFAVSPTFERYIRLEFASAGQWELPQLIYSKTLAPSIGPEQGWDEDLIENALHIRKSSGAVAHFQLGPDIQTYQFVFPGVDLAADHVILDALYDNGTHRVFVFDPPYDDSTTILAWITSRNRMNEERIPAGGAKTFRYEFSIEESLA